MKARLICASLALALFTLDGKATSMSIQAFGNTLSGKPVQKVSFTNALGMRVSCIDYGATMTAIEVPDRHGKLANIMLSLPDLASYEKTNRRFSAIMGRYAGRIGQAKFMLNDRIINLSKNAKGLSLHGDPDGFDKRVWSRKEFSDADSQGVIFHLDSPDGDQYYPGHLSVNVTYRLRHRVNELRIEYEAKTDAPTVINLTNHGFFNLAGAGNPIGAGLHTHYFKIMADRYASTDEKRVPNGKLLSVKHTPLDFRRPRKLSKSLNSNQTSVNKLLGTPAGFDHSLVFSRQTPGLKLVAVIVEESSGRILRIQTTEPSVQFNSGNGFDGSEIGSEGVAYQRHDGFAFETQHLPDSPNHPNFPSTTLHPGKPYRSMTSFSFSRLRRK
jgi:aldose 1-epimerase